MPDITPEEFFEDEPVARQLFEALRAMIDAAGPSTVRVTKSQIAFARRRQFAWAWMPRKVLRGRGAPLVLTLSLPARDLSPRWKQVVEPYPGRFTHHLELFAESDLDEQVREFIGRAWAAAA